MTSNQRNSPHTVPESLATEGRQGTKGNAESSCDRNDTLRQDLSLWQGLVCMNLAQLFLIDFARRTDQPPIDIVDAADMLDAAESLLSRQLRSVDGAPRE